jgi:hypothetical protein
VTRTLALLGTALVGAAALGTFLHLFVGRLASGPAGFAAWSALVAAPGVLGYLFLGWTCRSRGLPWPALDVRTGVTLIVLVELAAFATAAGVLMRGLVWGLATVVTLGLLIYPALWAKAALQPRGEQHASFGDLDAELGE